MKELKDILQVTNHIRGHLDEIEYILEENGIDIERGVKNGDHNNR